MDSPTEQLEDIASDLRKNAWLLGEFFRACRDAGLPDDLSREVTVDYHRECILWDQPECE